jgi:hypothetical protein
MPLRCFPFVRRQLQRAPPTQIRPCPPRRKKALENKVPPVDMMRVFEEYLAPEKHQTSRAGNLDACVQVIFVKAFRTEASRQMLIRGLQPLVFTPPSPQPC